MGSKARPAGWKPRKWRAKGCASNPQGLEREFKRGEALREQLLASVAVVPGQQTQLALRSHFHTPLERWRAGCSYKRRAGEKNGCNEFDLLPEFLAQMLVSDAARAVVIVDTLQRARLLTYNGNHSVLISRQEMEAASCGCSDYICATFKRLLG